MLFSSTFFIFGFLPIVLFGYYILFRDIRKRNLFLLMASIIFYAWSEPWYVIVLFVSIIGNYYFGLRVDYYRDDKRQARRHIVWMLVFNLLILYIFKYLCFSLSLINMIGIVKIPIMEIVLPVGISFITFQGISYVMDVYRGHGKVLKSILDVGLYISLFPQLIAGPIVRYETISTEMYEREVTSDDFTSGIALFITGLSKKVVLSNQFALIADKAFDLQSTNELGTLMAWLGAIGYTLQIYFDFGGYSDMAIGLGRMFGFHFNPNFNYPYISKSISEFWRRWHISLGTWFRDYVYIPLGGNRHHLLRNTLIVWTLTGLWHGANFNFIIWGLFFGVVIVIEKFTGFGKLMEETSILGHIYTMLLVIISWVIFRAPDMQVAGDYLKTMFTLNTEANDIAYLYFKENIVILIIGVIISAPLFQLIKEKYEYEDEIIQNLLKIVAIVGLAVIFLVSIVYLVKGTYNPFIYFNF